MTLPRKLCAGDGMHHPAVLATVEGSVWLRRLDRAMSDAGAVPAWATSDRTRVTRVAWRFGVLPGAPFVRVDIPARGGPGEVTLHGNGWDGGVRVPADIAGLSLRVAAGLPVDIDDDGWDRVDCLPGMRPHLAAHPGAPDRLRAAALLA